MPWIVLVISALFEAVWATALSRVDGLKPEPLITFAVGAVISMAGLTYAMRTIPVGTAYAVWVGIGAAATAGYAWTSGAESFGVVKLLCIVGIVACVIGLKLSH